MGGESREGGGGRAGEGVAGDDSILLGHRRRRPGEVDLSLSNICYKHLRRTSWSWEQFICEG